MTYIQTTSSITFNSFNRENYLDFTPKYIGKNVAISAADNLTTWVITKRVYTNENKYVKQTLTGRWDQRELLSWTI